MFQEFTPWFRRLGELDLKTIPRQIILFITTSLLLVISLGGGCALKPDFDSRLNFIVKPYRFSTIEWEFETLLQPDKQSTPGPEVKVEDKPRQVMEYFSLVERINALKSDPASLETELNKLEGQKAVLEDVVAETIKQQIKEVLAEQAIFNPLDKYINLRTILPPLNFELEPPPHLLVISPRDRIESIREITSGQNLSLEEIEGIEAKVDKLGVSSLVIKLGGFGGTYPTLVANDATLRFTIDTATEEWLHQYLVFKPLGFLYLLDLTGLSRNYEIATMNETVAGMVSKEIGAILYQRYYSQYESGDSQPPKTEPEFDFNREMRDIRMAVDKYLAQGEIEQAEEFMEQKRQYLAAKGHYIRKLNQAYFAFHGTYADRPTSISPIGIEMKRLRNQSASLKDFLDTVAGMTSRQDLIYSIKPAA
jgi:hypothetical protein